MELLQESQIELSGKVYNLGKFPATVGREILTQYPTSALPKLGDYKINEELMLRLMSYVSVETEKGPLRLSTRALVDNHIGSAEDLMRLEWAMMEKNFAFFANGKASGFLSGLGDQVQALILKTLTNFSPPSSAGK